MWTLKYSPKVDIVACVESLSVSQVKGEGCRHDISDPIDWSPLCAVIGSPQSGRRLCERLYGSSHGPVLWGTLLLYNLSPVDPCIDKPEMIFAPMNIFESTFSQLGRYI